MGRKPALLHEKIKQALLAFLLPCCLLAKFPMLILSSGYLTTLLPTIRSIPNRGALLLFGRSALSGRKVSNPNRGEYAMKVKKQPANSGSSRGLLAMDALFQPFFPAFRLSMEVRYDSIVPPGKTKG